MLAVLGSKEDTVPNRFPGAWDHDIMGSWDLMLVLHAVCMLLAMLQARSHLRRGWHFVGGPLLQGQHDLFQALH